MNPAKLCSLLVLALSAAPVFAQGAAADVQRNINRQQRIENGLQSGALTTREAAWLEHDQARISRTEAHALKDGKLTPQEKQRIDRMQDKASRDIYAQSHDRQVGNPNSASSHRMQASVARNIAQQQRIEGGIKNGSLTNREVGKLERGQARLSRNEARAGRNGHVSAHEQAHLQRVASQGSRRIARERHDARRRV